MESQNQSRCPPLNSLLSLATSPIGHTIMENTQCHTQLFRFNSLMLETQLFGRDTYKDVALPIRYN